MTFSGQGLDDYILEAVWNALRGNIKLRVVQGVRGGGLG